MKFVTYISLLLSSFVLSGCGPTDSTKRVDGDSTATTKPQQIQLSPDSSGQYLPADTSNPGGHSNIKNLVGYWLMPHNAGINLTFDKNGTFVFNDYNTKLNRAEELHGRYQLQKEKLNLIYNDRPMQTFRIYKDGDIFYIKKGNYYFVQGEKP